MFKNIYAYVVRPNLENDLLYKIIFAQDFNCVYVIVFSWRIFLIT